MSDYLVIEDSKPEVQPRFAIEDLVDPTSGVNNVVTPNTAFQNYGWHPFRMIPPRNIMNWIHRHTYFCINWLMDVFYPRVDAEFDSVNNRLINLEGMLPLSGQELTGTTYSTGDATTIALPEGFTNGNVYVLSAKIQIGGGDNELWYGLGDYFNVGWNTRTDEQSIQIHHPDNATYHSKPYKVIIAKFPSL